MCRLCDFERRLGSCSLVAAGVLPSELDAILRMLENADARLQGNPWQYPPLGVVTGGLAEVRKYFTAVFAEGSRVVERPLKVVLIGKEKVGKTRYDSDPKLDSVFAILFVRHRYFICSILRGAIEC